MAIGSIEIGSIEIGSIELRGIQISFGRHEIFHDLNLLIPSSEKLVLMGPSGQGKSVLLKVLAGLLRPRRGQVLIDGQDLHSMSETARHLLMRSMGMLFQKNALFDSLSVAENVAFPLREISKIEAKEIDVRVAYFLEAVGLSHVRDLFPDEISGGMQKRLGIARALALEPKIILYDDPTAGLDPITSRKIIDLILELQKKNRATVVAVTNDMARAYQLADRLALVAQGELIITGSVEETKQHSDRRVQQFIRGQLEGPLTERAS